MGDSAGMAETGNRQGRGRVTPEQWEKVKEVLMSALELAPENRRAYLDRRCADLSLRREVESLIAAHESGASQFMGESSPVSGPVSGLPDGEKLRAYVILGPLGGGEWVRCTAHDRLTAKGKSRSPWLGGNHRYVSHEL
jgi:hypothetical protein